MLGWVTHFKGKEDVKSFSALHNLAKYSERKFHNYQLRKPIAKLLVGVTDPIHDKIRVATDFTYFFSQSVH